MIWIYLTMLLGCLGLSFYQIPRMWSGKHPWYSNAGDWVPEWWVYSQLTWTAWRRSQPTSLIMFDMILVIGALLEVADTTSFGWRVIIWIVLCLLLIVVALTVASAVFGRPRWAIPPAARRNE